MSIVTDSARQPKGRPNGGQFAANSRPDATIDLAAAAAATAEQGNAERAYLAGNAAAGHAKRAANTALRDLGRSVGADELAFTFDIDHGAGPMVFRGALSDGDDLTLEPETRQQFQRLAWPFDEAGEIDDDGAWSWDDNDAAFDVLTEPRPLSHEAAAARLAELDAAREQLATEQFEIARDMLTRTVRDIYPDATSVSVFDHAAATGRPGPAVWRAHYIHGGDGKALWTGDTFDDSDPFTRELDQWAPRLGARIDQLDGSGAFRVLSL